MERQDFLKKTLTLGIASCGMALFSEKNGLPQTEEKHADREQKFKEAWVCTLMENMEKQLDKPSRDHLMEMCGRECARRGAVRTAQSCKGDVRKMTEMLSQYPDLDMQHTDERTVVVTYNKCFCELVGKGPDRLPDTYCECSRGWLMEMFETAAQKKVEVVTCQTIKRGGSNCQFILKVNT
jgi:predicted hydrocarbon binding protein